MARIKDISDSLGVTSQTIRSWSDRFANFLSEGATPPKGETRNFVDDDVAVFTTVAALQARGMNFDQIEAELRKDFRVDNPTLEADQQLATPAGRATMIERVNKLVADNESLTKERDELRQQVADLNREVGRLEGRLDSGGANRVVELERKIAVLEYKLQLAQQTGDDDD